jgi:hypothetical protein
MGAYRDTFLLNKTLELKNKYNTNLFIETGTNDGDSLKILSQHFYALYSCELFENSYNIAKENIKNLNNVKIYNISSSIFMENICEELKGRNDIIFFLDAHWGPNSPLLTELDIIFKYELTCPIIIHDFFVPDENNNAKFGYDEPNGVKLDINYVKNHMDKIFDNSYDVYYPHQITEPTGFAIFTKK